MAQSPLNKDFRQAYAIAKQIPHRKNKRLAILAWCRAAKNAIKISCDEL